LRVTQFSADRALPFDVPRKTTVPRRWLDGFPIASNFHSIPIDFAQIRLAQSAGQRWRRWNARDNARRGCAARILLYQVTSDDIHS